MAEPLRIVFMGSDPVALPLLDWLVGEGSTAAHLAGVVTGPDKVSGRGQGVRPNAVKAWAAGHPVAVLQPERLDADVLAAISALRPDVALVVAYGHILREDAISLPRLGTLNLHASILPKFRGASPIQAAVASGERETGMTLMRIVRELDAGPIADVQTTAITSRDTADQVEARLAAAAVPLVSRALPLLARGELTFAAQDGSRASYCRRLSKADGVLDFSQPAEVLAARINALHPWPSVTIDLAGAPVKLGLAGSLFGGTYGPPGTVNALDSEGLLVSTGLGVLRLLRLQRPGGRMLPAPEFFRGFAVAPGTVIPSHPMPPLVADSPFRR